MGQPGRILKHLHPFSLHCPLDTGAYTLHVSFWDSTYKAPAIPCHLVDQDCKIVPKLYTLHWNGTTSAFEPSMMHWNGTTIEFWPPNRA